MTSCAEVRTELVAVLRGEATAAIALAVEQHVGRCAACAAERESLRETTELVRRHVHPEVSPDARLRLRAALGDELRMARTRSVARFVRPAFAVPAALVVGAIAAWLGAPRTSPRPDAAAIDVRLGRAVANAGDLGPLTLNAVSRGLSWLAARQRPDGAWGPADGADRETTASATALALLAFAADGQSPHHGPHALSLGRARDRLTELLAAGFSADADRKPVYAQALGVRALAAAYALDHGAMTSDERRDARTVAAAAGRALRAWQRSDGGFGYVPDATRSDSSCTLFAAAALAELRGAGVLDATGALVRAGRYLDTLRSADGRVGYAWRGDRPDTAALTAALLSLGADATGPARSASPQVFAEIEQAAAEGGDALLTWTATAALARHDRPLGSPVKSLLAAQRQDGAWAAEADRRCAAAGDTVTTAFGVLALAQTYTR